MLRREQRIKTLILFTVFSILFIGVGYAIFNTQVTVNGMVDVDKTDWNVYFDNLHILSNTSGNGEAEIEDKNTVVNYAVRLNKPGDTFSLSVDAVNDGSLDAMINSITETQLTNEQKQYINYTIEYAGGTALQEKQLLRKGTRETILVTIEYDYESDILLEDDDPIELSLKLEYVKDDGTGVLINTVCKRATTLHTEECTQTNNNGCHAVGYIEYGSKKTTTITYGSLGIEGSDPEVGDAFDCDVDNSGTFDADERFYYISDSGSNEGYTTLIYYKNVGTAKYYSSAQGYNGPAALLDTLPSTSEWSNPSLNTSITRQIKNELGANTLYNGSYTLPEFTYTDRAARLLTYQEIYNACYDGTTQINKKGALDKCEFLLESSAYAADSNDSGTLRWWLETPDESNYTSVWGVFSSNRNLNSGLSASNNFGVRPAIEVRINDLDY